MSVRVVARIRPCSKAELDKDTIVTAHRSAVDAPPTIVRIPNPKNEAESFSFQFNSVYGPEATQQQIFDGEVAPTVKHLFNGFDVTLFAYGVTGTGKTHTMRGGKSLADRGVIPRLLSGVYRRGRKVEKDSQGQSQVAVSMSYYEIYNDKVFDLFEAPEKRTAAGLALRDNGGKTVVVGLSERPCESLKEFERLYDQANHNRSTGATKLNAHSSRSHAILCVRITITTGDQTTVSTASAIDLAGSEDNRRTENSKERLVESSSINKSLFVLASCVEAISRKASRIPYRESKMTRILSLGQNNGLTIMILNLAPIRSYHLDTLSSLNFANRTKKIEVREVENEPILMGCARPVTAGVSLQRQPLRPLASAALNANVRKATVDATTKQNAKPAKAFSVYADTARNGVHEQRTGDAIKRSSPMKRPSDSSFPASNRPHKTARQSPFGTTRRLAELAISKASIEDMVEKKVSEILAARALDNKKSSAPTAPPPTTEISEEMKQRLELLEQRIERHGQDDDSRAEGLSFLLMAKQHHARGEHSSALKMYELAREHFPDNAKLEAKIAKLKAAIQEKKRKEKEELESAAVFPLQGKPKRPPRCSSTIAKNPISATIAEDNDFPDDDEDYQEDHSDAYEDSDTDKSRSKSKPKPKSKNKSKPKKDAHAIKTSPSYHDAPLPPPQQHQLNSPRTQHLLHIINSRDVAQIKLLRGVGPKKAEAIVEALRFNGDEADADADAGEWSAAAAAAAAATAAMRVNSLDQLGRLRGVGIKTVENMRMGICVADAWGA